MFQLGPNRDVRPQFSQELPSFRARIIGPGLIDTLGNVVRSLAKFVGVIQFGSVIQKSMKGFTEPRWKILKGDEKTVRKTDDAVRLEPGTAFGHPSVLQCSEVRFKLAFISGGFSAARLRLFCSGTSREKSSNLVIGRFGGLLIPAKADLGFLCNGCRDGADVAVAALDRTGRLRSGYGRGDGFAVTISNGAPNKIDAYLTKATRYEAVVDPVSGAVEAKLTVTLTNAIPGTALPPVVVGNVVGAPSGTSISYVTVFSPLQLMAARVDGVDVPWVPEVERGWKTYSRFVRIAPHAAVMIEMTLRGRVDVSRGYWLQLRPQPGAMAEGVSIDVRTRNGLTVLRRGQRLETSIQLRGGLSWNRRLKRISP